MKLLLALATSSLFAQTLALSGSASYRPGEPLTVRVVYASVVPVESIQWKLSTELPVSIARGVDLPSSKSVACSETLCVASGLVLDPLKSGVIAVATISIPPDRTAPLMLSLESALGADSSGFSVIVGATGSSVDRSNGASTLVVGRSLIRR